VWLFALAGNDGRGITRKFERVVCGGVALPSGGELACGGVSARREPRPPEWCGDVRLGGSLALPSGGEGGGRGVKD
jgi:hypothetical protein